MCSTSWISGPSKSDVETMTHNSRHDFLGNVTDYENDDCYTDDDDCSTLGPLLNPHDSGEFCDSGKRIVQEA